MAFNGTINKLDGQQITVSLSFTYRGVARQIYGEAVLAADGKAWKTEGATVNCATSVDYRPYTLTWTVPTSGLGTRAYALFLVVWPDLATKNQDYDQWVWANQDGNGRQQAVAHINVLGSEFGQFSTGLG